jgi:hypothetical protein
MRALQISQPNLGLYVEIWVEYGILGLDPGLEPWMWWGPSPSSPRVALAPHSCPLWVSDAFGPSSLPPPPPPPSTSSSRVGLWGHPLPSRSSPVHGELRLHPPPCPNVMLGSAACHGGAVINLVLASIKLRCAFLFPPRSSIYRINFNIWSSVPTCSPVSLF